MKKRIFAVLLAVCMIASTCVFFASAVPFNVGDVVTGSPTKGSNLAKVDVNKTVTVSAKSTPRINKGLNGAEVTADNVDELITFKVGSTARKFKGDLEKYFNVSGTIKDSTTVDFTEKSANSVTAREVVTAITSSDGDQDVTAKVSAQKTYKYYILTDYSPVVSVKFIASLCTLTIGVRFFGDTYKNLSASEIAKVTATVHRTSGAVSKTTSSVSDDIKDLMIGDVVTLSASLKDPAEKEYYAFNCWVTKDGEVISTDETISFVVDGSASYYACFVELKDRHTIDYISNGNGKLVVLKDKDKKYVVSREVFDGEKEQISVLEGRDFTFTIVPDEGYEISKVVIDGKTDVASFRYILDGTEGIIDALKTLINATGPDRKFTTPGTAEGTAKRAVAEGTYQFKNIKDDHSIEVTFSKIENFEVPSGMELPTMEAGETVTLATGAAAENAGGDASTTVPAEDGAASGGSAIGGVVNPATGSASAIGVFAALSLAAGAAFVTAKKKED